MDRRLEHFLLAAGVAKQLSGEFAGVVAGFKGTAISLELEQLLWWDVYLQPFSEIHRTGAVAPCCP